MDNIKFRVWCEFTIDGKKYAEMAGPENWFLLTQTGKLMSHGPMNFDPNIEQKHDKLIVEFFTGLRDKKNKEAYFGDRVKHNDGSEGEIIWDRKSLRVAFKWDDRKITYPITNADYNDFVIIGTIHENPELLQEAKP